MLQDHGLALLVGPDDALEVRLKLRETPRGLDLEECLCRGAGRRGGVRRARLGLGLGLGLGGEAPQRPTSGTRLCSSAAWRTEAKRGGGRERLERQRL